MNNKWILYQNSKIIPEKNFKVDSLESYLATLSKETIFDADDKNKSPQYIKHDLNLFVKINKTQATLNFFNSVNNYNYMSIQNSDDSQPVYYFIIKKEWTAENTLGLILKMDTVNTFTPERSSFVISDRTLVDREHKDRLTGRTYYDNIVPYTFTNKKEYRINPTPDDAFEISGVKMTIRKYDANGFLEWEIENVGTIQCVRDTLFNPFIWTAQDNDTYQTVWEINSFDATGGMNADFSNGIYYTVEFETAPAGGDIDDPSDIPFDKVRRVVFKRVIDFNSEGLTPVKYHDDTEDKEISADMRDWYLVYKNENAINPTNFEQVNPVNCLLCADLPITVKGLDGFAFATSGLNTSKNYYLFPFDLETFTNLNISINHSGTIKTLSMGRCICLYWDGSAWKSHWLVVAEPNYGESLYRLFYYSIGGIEVGDLIYNAKWLYSGERENPADIYNKGIVASAYAEAVDLTGGGTYSVKDISSIDRTDSKLIKIIKLPYCPSNYTAEQEGLGMFEYEAGSNLLKLRDLNTKFNNTFEFEFNPLNEFEMTVDHFKVNQARNIIYESKLYHSDYRHYKFVYDSFGFTFQLEKVDTTNIDEGVNLRIEFTMTTTINSRFMFKFPQYVLKYSESDYDNVLPIARNNEIPLYNSAYITYLRTGYNYDVKSKNREQAVSVANTLLTGVGAIASFIATPIAGPKAIAGGVGLTIATMKNIIGTANTIATTEQNLEAKQTQLRAQAISVSGSDDVDLMSAYTNNKAKFELYEISPKMKKAMYDVFYYTGYISGVMKVPNTTSRYWFNFVSCDLQLESNVNIPDNCLADLKDCYKNGITVLHAHGGEYDWNREKENWEVSLMN